MTVELGIKIAAAVFICFYAIIRCRYELQMMQQNSYRLGRYWRWLRSDIVNTTRITDLLMLTVIFIFHDNRWESYAVGMMGALSLYKSIRELRVKYKKPLVFTPRAIRFYSVGITIVLLALSLVWYKTGMVYWALFTSMAFAVFSPFAMSLALILLMPFEKLINRWYYNDARRILRAMPGMTVIGITGSYGKTSTKHYLHRILSEKFNVIMTPGSYNTTLGVVRTVRERLKPFHDIFIVEMGAKQPGDIAEICRLVNPFMGIITAVGEQHLESFKTIENVQKTKFELTDALPQDGIAILNNDFEQIANRPINSVNNVFRYASVSDKVDYRIVDISYGRGETTFAIDGPEGISEPFTTKLVGIHNLSNILAGYIAGKQLGMTDPEMRYAISQIEQVEHRLNIKQTPSGITIIDDAFNSNPHGSKMALDVLASFTDGERIVVTPGLVELGSKQYEYNHRFGVQIASSCDFAIIVGEYNREAILGGVTEGGFEESKIYVAKDFAEASRKIREMVKPGDVVLYENDLPDTYK